MSDAPHPHDDLDLIERAAQLYPDSAYLQAQWLRAVVIVRATARGWLLDMPVVRVRDGGPVRGGA